MSNARLANLCLRLEICDTGKWRNYEFCKEMQGATH